MSNNDDLDMTRGSDDDHDYSVNGHDDNDDDNKDYLDVDSDWYDDDDHGISKMEIKATSASSPKTRSTLHPTSHLTYALLIN